MGTRTVLIATLGGQPQVVTFALDALLARGEKVQEVVVVHLGSPRYRQAFQQLAWEFPGDRYNGQTCHFRGVPVRAEDRVLGDVRTTVDADAVWQTMHSLVRTVKATGAHIHLLPTGGRRMMALLTVSAALLQLDHGDHVWHLYTPHELQEAASGGAIMHASPDGGIELMRVPIAPLGAYFPQIRTLAGASPQQVLAEQTRWLGAEDRQRCQAVVGRLSKRQLEVLHAFAEGLAPQLVAARLTISLKTVDSHKTVILAECRNAWSIAEDGRMTYHFLREKFGRYFQVG